MSDSAPSPELLRSLGRLVRGLSSLFWGLPLALLVCAGTAIAGWFKAFGLPPLAATGLLLFGLWQLGSFQKQERPWRNALDGARLLAMINFGLTPFLYWWNRVPQNAFFSAAVGVFAVSALLFLFSLNRVLLRLGAMLPDEALRHETRQYTAMNQVLIAGVLLLAASYVALARVPELPDPIGALLVWLERGWFSSLVLLILILLPLAMTMALIWKTKEVILDSVFGAQH